MLSNKEESLMEDSDERMDTSNIKLEDLQSLDNKVAESTKTKSMKQQENSPSDDENETHGTAEFKKNSNIQILKSSERFINKPGDARQISSSKQT